MTGYNSFGGVYGIGMGAGDNTETIHAILKRLAAYEDTGLEPQEVKDMAENVETRLLTWCESRYGFPVGKLMDLLDAESEGRLVVLPCKVGDCVFWVHDRSITACRVHRFQMNKKCTFVGFKNGGRVCNVLPVNEFGKTIFLTREEAIEALEQESV